MACTVLVHLFAGKLITLAFLISTAWSSTHWVVTEDGMIQGLPDSVFYLRRPYDIVALMQQEYRVAFVESLANDLDGPMNSKLANVSTTNTFSETWNESACNECNHMDKRISDFDMYEPVVPSFAARNVRFVDYLGNESTASTSREPLCTTVAELDFSMHSFEHLQVIRWRKNVTLLPEIELIHILPMMKDIAGFRNLVHGALAKNSDSWVVHTLAAFYFRLIGDAYNAIECLRRALYFVPREFKDIPLLCLGNVLHRSHHTEEAAIVVHAAVDMAPDIAINHYLLGSIYMSMSDYNLSSVCYKNALQLDPSFKEAALRILTLHCENQLESTGTTQSDVIHRKLKKLSTFEKHVEFLQQRVRLMQEQAAVEVRVTSQVQYAEGKIRQRVQETVALSDSKDCVQSTDTGLAVLSCGRLPKIALADFHIVLDDGLQQLLRELDTQVDKLHSVITEETDWNSPVAASLTNHQQDWSLPTLPTLYPKHQGIWSAIPEDFQVIQSLMEDCDVNYLTVTNTPWFLPAENKGFEVSRFLGELQGLKNGKLHSQPWRQPYCNVISDETIPTENFIIPLLDPLDMFPQGFDFSKAVLQYLKRYSNGGGHFIIEEFGQRVITASLLSLGPKGLMETLGSLYWLSLGELRHAVECLRSSIGLVPKTFLDVPLVFLASWLYNIGHVDSALIASMHALKANEFEPITNILMAEMFVKKDNLTSAMYHFRKALQQDPQNIDVIQRLWQVMCQIKGNSQDIKLADVKSHMSSSHFASQGNNHYNVESLMAAVSLQPTDGESLSTTPRATTTIEDDPLPETMVKVKHEHCMTPLTLSECQMLTSPHMWHFTSTWLSVSAKGIDVNDHLGVWEHVTGVEPVQPICDSNFPSSALTLDHLAGVRHRSKLSYPPETGLKEFFQTLGRSGQTPEPIEMVATRLTHALQKNSTSWVLTTLAALHWRIMGNAEQAISCLRQALSFAPRYARDIPLVSLANILHRAGLFNGALIVANMALEISPEVVVIHFTLANILADKGDLARAETYYKSTLTLQPSFEPAKDRLRFIQCSALQRTSRQ